jgi:putative oxidoreductase
MTTELLGPLGLAVSLLMRVAAVGMLCEMSVALIRVPWPRGFFMNWTGTQQGEGCKYHRLMIGIALTVLMIGADIWSLDRMRAGCTPRSQTQN